VASPLVPAGQLGIGLQLPVQAQSRIFVEPWERDAGPEEIVAVAQAADDAGFLYVGVCDHVGVPDSHVGTMGATWYEPVTTLAFVAAATQRVRLLTHVYVLALRHPIAAAKQFATLDRLSGGRVIVGVGAGHVEAEFAALGVPFAERGAVLDEACDALRVLLDEPVASFSGKWFTFDGLHLAPRPVQAHVPIWVGGSGAPALRRAARIGDGWIPQGTPLAEMPAKLAIIREHADVRVVPDLGAMAPPMYVGDPAWDVGRWTVTGSGEQLAGHLRAYRDLGCTHVQVRLRSRSCDELLDQIGRFAAEVMPQL
jgi:probable F420-dependent oxidoreductase